MGVVRGGWKDRVKTTGNELFILKNSFISQEALFFSLDCTTRRGKIPRAWRLSCLPVRWSDSACLFFTSTDNSRIEKEAKIAGGGTAPKRTNKGVEWVHRDTQNSRRTGTIMLLPLASSYVLANYTPNAAL